MKIAFFDAKPYDLPSFTRYAEAAGLEIKFLEAKLSEDTVGLADGFDGVCVFVNDTVSAPVIDRLAEMGVGVVALRCAGYNNVDVRHAAGRVRVVRVPAYSPFAVAEHTMALLLTSVRRIHKAYIRTRDYRDGADRAGLHGHLPRLWHANSRLRQVPRQVPGGRGCRAVRDHGRAFAGE